MYCTGCPDGWHPFRDSCYWAAPQPATFIKAQEACEKLGAELAEIRDQAIMDFFFRLRCMPGRVGVGVLGVGVGNVTCCRFVLPLDACGYLALELRASLSITCLQTLPELVTPLKSSLYSISPRSCLYTDVVSALRMVWELIRLWRQHCAQKCT